VEKYTKHCNICNLLFIFSFAFVTAKRRSDQKYTCKCCTWNPWVSYFFISEAEWKGMKALCSVSVR